MEKIIEQFGIQPTLVLAQVFNFLILLWLLNRFLYKPILKVLDERRQKIAKSLKEADQIAKNLAQTEADREATLKETVQESKQIISDANKQALLIIEQAHAKAAEDIELLVAKAKSRMAAERQQLHSEIRQELASLVVSGLETVAQKELSSQDRQRITQTSLKNL